MTNSIVIEEKYADYCFFCRTSNINGEHHLIFGNGGREKADQDGLKVPICNRCHLTGRLIERVHDNSMAERLSKMLGQAVYERNECAKGATLNEAREIFRKRYKESYL